MSPIVDLAVLLRSMQPVLNPGLYVFATLAENQSLTLDEVIASVRESEGLSVVVESAVASRYGLDATFPCAWITLKVNSDLAAVGLTAAFANALGAADISCNVVAGTQHDHIFVPYAQAQAAMDALRDLQHRPVTTNLT